MSPSNKTLPILWTEWNWAVVPTLVETYLLQAIDNVVLDVRREDVLPKVHRRGAALDVHHDRGWLRKAHHIVGRG